MNTIIAVSLIISSVIGILLLIYFFSILCEIRDVLYDIRDNTAASRKKTKTEGSDEEYGNSNEVSAVPASNGLPKKTCPKCGDRHDFDYPKCPKCKYNYDI